MSRIDVNQWDERNELEETHVLVVNMDFGHESEEETISTADPPIMADTHDEETEYHEEEKRDNLYESSSDDDDETRSALLKIARKGKKRGRRSNWDESVIDDLVDIVCSDDNLLQKLVYEITKKNI